MQKRGSQRDEDLDRLDIIPRLDLFNVVESYHWMNCANCGKPIAAGASTEEDGYHFCNAICRYEWKKRGKPTPFASGTAPAGKAAVRELDFPIEPPGFENRQMHLRLSYLTAPKIFLDGEQLQPVKSGLLWKRREYSALSNFGKQVTISIIRRVLDQVPGMEVDGQKFEIARPLTGWEYAWISLPLLILFSGGGAIPGLIAGAALYSNSILMRRIGHWLPRYVLTGATTLMAFIIFLRVVTVVSPFLQSLAGRVGGQTVAGQLLEATRDVNKRCPYMLDEETRVDSLSVGAGNVLIYNYTLVKRSAGELNVDQLKSAFRPTLSDNARTNPDMKQLRDHEVSFAYRYFDKAGKPIFDLVLRPPEYR